MSSLEISQGLYRQAIIIKYHWKTPLAKYLRILMANESISVWPVGHAVEVLCDWQQVDWVWYPQDPPPVKTNSWAIALTILGFQQHVVATGVKQSKTLPPRHQSLRRRRASFFPPARDFGNLAQEAGSSVWQETETVS